MPHKVLDVGQCGLDHPRIKQMIESRFDATVDLAHTASEAIQLASSNHYDLIMVNRLLDADHSPGVDLIQDLRSHSEIVSVPVMLVSNYQDAQDEAVAAGAVPGFGKNAINAPAAVSAIAPYLSGEADGPV